MDKENNVLFMCSQNEVSTVSEGEYLYSNYVEMVDESIDLDCEFKYAVITEDLHTVDYSDLGVDDIYEIPTEDYKKLVEQGIDAIEDVANGDHPRYILVNPSKVLSIRKLEGNEQ